MIPWLQINRNYPWINILLIAHIGLFDGLLRLVATDTRYLINILISMSIYLTVPLLAGYLLQLLINLFRKKKNKQNVFHGMAYFGFFFAIILFFLRLGVVLVVALSG